jgi:MOSC domain-containing protein YiiM/ferredoxin-NADP reductase
MRSYLINSDDVPTPPPCPVLQVRTGKIRPLASTSLRSAIAKIRRYGPIPITLLGIPGDEQQYEFHGGVDKALHQYCSAHYKTWAEEQPTKAHLFKAGGYGENLVCEELNENNVCIGDIFTIGGEQGVTVQVSEPRQPCYKLNHRFEWKRASVRIQESGRTGWYLRVLKEGSMAEGDQMRLVERINPTWSISRVQKFMYGDTSNTAVLQELSVLPGLGDEIVKLFKTRLVKGTEDMSNRLLGMPGRRVAVIWRTYRVTEKQTLTPRISKFVFTVADTSEPMEDLEFKAFAHMRLKFGPKDSLVRAYSVVSGNMAKFELGVSRDDNSRGGSIYLHDMLKVGDTVEVARGHEDASALAKKSRYAGQKLRHQIIVGGIGITAFLGEIRELESSGADYHIHYAIRSKADAAYLDTLSPMHTTLYAKDEGERLDLEKLIPNPEEDIKTMLYCCGPSKMMKECRTLAEAAEYPSALTHFEDFGASEELHAGPEFSAEVKSNGKVVTVPTGKSLLEILNQVGMDVPSSCEVGNCGVCAVGILKGKVDHRGIALTEEEREEGSMLSCVSRGVGRILVDL